MDEFKVGDEVWFVEGEYSRPYLNSGTIIKVYERDGYSYYHIQYGKGVDDLTSRYSTGIAKTRREVLPILIQTLGYCKRRCIESAFEHQDSITKYQIEYAQTRPKKSP